MKTTDETRALLRAHADDDTQWTMGRPVKNALSDLLDDLEEARGIEAIQRAAIGRIHATSRSVATLRIIGDALKALADLRQR